VKEKLPSVQAYGKDRAKFKFVSDFFEESLLIVYLVFDIYSWLWVTSGEWLTYAGYGEEYEVRLEKTTRDGGIENGESLEDAIILKVTITIYLFRRSYSHWSLPY
jgi:hypothetical protein